MPPHQRVGRHDRRDLVARVPAEHLRLGRETTTLVIVQSKSPALHLLLQYAVLLDQVRDHVRLMPVHPTGNGQQKHLQRVDVGSHGPF